MRIETVDYKVFTFSELSEEAKEKVKERVLDDRSMFDTDIFTQDCIEHMRCKYGMDSLDVNYSLGYCQGDGLSFTGEVDIIDFLEYPSNKELLEKNFTPKELKRIAFLYNELGNIKIERYTHHYYHRYSVSFDYKSYLSDYLSGIKLLEDTSEKFRRFIKSIFMEECSYLENQGYKFFYEISMDEVEELCDCYDWEFLEDGEIFDKASC